MSDILSKLGELLSAGERGVLVTVVAVGGPSPATPGARMWWRPDGTFEGTVGGGALEHRVQALAPEVLASRQPRLIHFDLGRDLGMSCGGEATVFIEPLGAADHLFLFGAGHIAEHLCELAARCGFLVTVCDRRDELRTRERFPSAMRLSEVDDPSRLGELDLAALAPDAHVMVVTHSHAVDFALVEAILPLRPRYLGMIGSQVKRRRMDGRLRERGASPEEIAGVRCPAGIPLGGRSPAEIAVSIVAELVQLRAERANAGRADAPEDPPEGPKGEGAPGAGSEGEIAATPRGAGRAR